MYKRILSAVCAMAVTFTMAISLPSVSVDTSGFVISASAAGEYEEAAAELHDHLKNLDKTFSISIIMDNKPDDPNKFLDDLFYDATAHTGDPTEGDWIHLHVYSMNCGYKVSKTAGGSFKITLEFDMVYNTTAEQAALADEKADRIIEYLDLDGKTDLEKIMEIYNYICQNVEYDLERIDDDSTEIEHSAYSALCEGKTVCQGYTLALYNLMLKAGIDCRAVTGAYNGGAHAWNIVKLDGKWYHIDATGDRTRSSYKFCLIPTSELTGHTLDDRYTSQEFLKEHPMADTAAEVSRDRITRNKDGFEYLPSLDSTTILSYTGAEKNVVVPEKIDGASVKIIASDCFVGNNIVESIEFSEGIEEIRGLFASKCGKLKKITLPSTADLSYITGDYTLLYGFGGFVQQCTSLEEIVVAEDSPYLKTVDGVLYDKDMSILVAYPAKKSDKTFAVPDSVKKINDDAFELNTYLETLAVPEGVENIGYRALLGCTGIKELMIPSTCTAIGDYALYTLSPDMKIYFPAEFAGPIEAKDLSNTTNYSNLTFVCEEDSYAYNFANANGIKTAEPEEETHVYIVRSVEPTCTTGGYTEHTCTICGYTYKDNETEPLGHKYIDTVIKPTCVSCGYTEHVCSVCGDSYKDSETDLIDHNFFTLDIPSTCEAYGYTEYVCSYCGYTYSVESTELAPHDFGEWTTVIEPTATTEGQAVHICKVCGEEETKVLEKLKEESSSKAEDSSSMPDESSSKAEDSSSMPEDSSSKAEDSSSKTDDSSIKAEDSSSKPDESSSKAEDSSSKPEDSSKAEDSSSKPEESSSKAEESSSKPDDSSSKSEDSSSKPEDSSSKAEDSSSKPEDSSTAEDSSSKPDDSSIKAEDSSSKPEDSSIKAEDSSSKPDESSSKAEDSSSKHEESSSTAEDSSSKPDDSSSKAEDSSSKPEDSSSKAEDSSSKPDDSSSKAEDSSSKPDDSSTAEDSSSKPEDSSTAEDSSSKPEESSSKAEDSSSMPDESSSKAEDSSSMPDESSSKAEDSSSKPDESSSKAEDSSSEPEDSSSTAEDSSSKPEDSSATEDSSSKPDDSSSKAEDSSSKPEDSSSKAEDSSSKPDESSSKAEDSSSKPEDSSSTAEDSSSKIDKSSSKSDKSSKNENSSSKGDASSKSEGKNSRHIGDVDGDGKIDIADAVTVINYINGNGVLTDEQLAYADVDGVDGVDIADAVAIINHINGIKALF